MANAWSLTIACCSRIQCDHTIVTKIKSTMCLQKSDTSFGYSVSTQKWYKFCVQCVNTKVIQVKNIKCLQKSENGYKASWGWISLTASLLTSTQK